MRIESGQETIFKRDSDVQLYVRADHRNPEGQAPRCYVATGAELLRSACRVAQQQGRGRRRAGQAQQHAVIQIGAAAIVAARPRASRRDGRRAGCGDGRRAGCGGQRGAGPCAVTCHDAEITQKLRNRPAKLRRFLRMHYAQLRNFYANRLRSNYAYITQKLRK